MLGHTKNNDISITCWVEQRGLLGGCLELQLPASGSCPNGGRPTFAVYLGNVQTKNMATFAKVSGFFGSWGIFFISNPITLVNLVCFSLKSLS